MKIKNKINFKLPGLIILATIITLGFISDDKTGNRPPRTLARIEGTQASGKQGDAYAMDVNNFWLPLNRKGVIADVNFGRLGSQGQFAGGNVLFSSGFFLGGRRNGEMWINAVASASLVEDYLQGTVATGSADPNAVLYVLNSQDDPFGPSWQDWIDAVNLGADFYDGDGDQVYNPVDRNGNGAWDPDEDRPDLIGDETVWCVYYDAVPQAQRRWNTISAKGIEVRQSVFAFASAGAIGNIIFVRYRIKYVGLDSSDPQQMTDVYLGVWADPDVGDFNDDVVGVDVPRNSGYTYGNQPDAFFGNQAPCFMIDFFSGPVAYIPGETFLDNNGDGIFNAGDVPLDTAKSVRGQIMGVIEYPGAKNLPISSFVGYINSDPSLSDPNNAEEAWNYINGLDKFGVAPDPCTFAYGEVRGGVDCATVDPRFWYSGDPVTDIGWIQVLGRDQRQMTNTGPFILERGVENEIVLAYVVGRSATPLAGVTATRAIDDGAQNIFDLNFLAPSPPPPPRPVLQSSDDFIDIIWETPIQVSYLNQTPTWDLRFEGYTIWAFRQNIAEDQVSGQQNSAVVARYDVNNFIENIYKENAETGGIEMLYPVSSGDYSINSTVYSDPVTGKIRVRIFNDPFTGLPIVKGTPYYFAVTSYAINYFSLVFKDDPAEPIGTVGDYYLSSFAFAQESENVRTIYPITAGIDLYNPPLPIQPANQVSGSSLGEVGYDILENSALTGSLYELTFTRDPDSIRYFMRWNLSNISTSTPLLANQHQYSYGQTTIDQQVTEGFITRIEDQVATIDDGTYNPESAIWYTAFDSASATGIWYVGRDIPQGQKVPTFEVSTLMQQSYFSSADRLRKVELRFGSPNSGKAYRYINGILGVPASNNYTYAAAIDPSDTSGRGIGNWDLVNDRANGFIDVPFTAWVVDERYNEEYQLAVGIVERRRTSTYPTGNPDGLWDPSSNLRGSGEMIIIFDRPFDPNGGHIELTGGEFSTPGGLVTVWSNLLKADGASVIPDSAIGITQEQKDIFKSSWFNAMYVIGLQKLNDAVFFTQGDEFIIDLTVYPYTAADVYQFSTLNGQVLTSDQEEELWKRVNVYPNPLQGYNPLTSFETNTPDEPFVTFTNLPEEVSVKIYSLSGQLLRSLETTDKASPTSPFLRWNLQNESGLRVASGMYLAIVSSPIYGDKVLKFGIILPQKQIQRF